MTTRERSSRLLSIVVVLAVALSTAACTSDSTASAPSPTPTVKSFELAARDALSPLSGVTSVNASTAPPGRADLQVTLSARVTENQAVTVAEATRKFASKYANGLASNSTLPWKVQAGVIIAGPDLSATDSTSANAVQFDVFPKPWHSASRAARAVMRVRALAGVDSVAITGSFPSVAVTDITALNDVVFLVRTMPLWEKGGDFTTTGGRVRITDLPGQLSLTSIREIIRQAGLFPEGQFWVEAAKAGPSAPALFIDRVTVEDARAITTAFLSVVVDAGAEKTYPLPFSIRANGPDGTIDSSGMIPGSKR